MTRFPGHTIRKLQVMGEVGRAGGSVAETSLLLELFQPMMQPTAMALVKDRHVCCSLPASVTSFCQTRNSVLNPYTDEPITSFSCTLWIADTLGNPFVSLDLKLRAPQFSSVQFSSVTQSCPTICDPMNRSTPGLPVHHQLPEFTQIHVH